MSTRVPIVAVVLLLAIALPARCQQTLADARTLYASAAYEEALTALDRLKGGGPPLQTLREIEQYRALCLLALKRQPEAEQAIEALVAVDPFYRPGEAEAAPWVRASFGDVRRRLLPQTAQRHFVDAKTLFGSQEYGKAAALLNRVLAMLEDPDVTPIEGDPWLVDLRTLAQGFLELSQNALATADAGSGPPSAAGGGAAAGATAGAARPDPAPVRVYSATDAEVTQPTVLFQRMPPWPSELRRFAVTVRGLLEIVIDESGLVESAVMREPVHRVYDALLVEAALTWRYTAATRGGRSVKYRRLIEVRGPTT